jgi:hypothetical protein
MNGAVCYACGELSRPYSPRQNILYSRAHGSRPCRRRRCTTPGMRIDTPPRPLYTRVYVSLRTAAVRERRFSCVLHRLTGGRDDASWAG